MSSEPREPSEEELRAAYEAELKRLRVEHVLLDNVVMMVNLGMRRTGLAPGTEDERSPDQVRLSIESVRALMPVIEQVAPAQASSIRDALSQLQLAYVRIGGKPAAEGEAPAAAPPPEGRPEAAKAAGAGQPKPAEPAAGQSSKPGEPGPAQRSGRLWVPGQ